MKCILGFGKSSKYTIYILIIFLCQLLCDSLLGFNNNRNKIISIFHFIPILKSHSLIKELLPYFSSLICGIILYSIKNKIEMKKEGEISIRKFQKKKDEIFGEKNSSIYRILFFIYFLHSLNTIIRAFLYSNIRYAEFWMLEIFILVILTKIVFKVKISNHLKFTVFLIAGILFIIKLINCYLPRTHHTNCNNEEECKKRYLSDNNILTIIDRKFGSYYYIPILFVAFILIAIFRDYNWVKTKYLIDIKSYAIFKIFICLGIVGSTVVFISIIVFTYKPCTILKNMTQVYNETLGSYTYYDEKNNRFQFSNQICFLEEYDGNTNELKLYFDNFKIFFKSYKQFRKEDKIELFIIFPLFIILNIIIIFSKIMMITHFDSNILLVNFNFYYFVQRLIEYIANEGDEQYLTKIQFYLGESEEIISIIGNLIYMEVIELRFCGLDYDLKKNIQKRADLDYSTSGELEINDLSKTSNSSSMLQ